MKKNLKNFDIILSRNYEDAMKVNADFTIEAEYGDKRVYGNLETLAHHGDLSENPAPCNTNVNVYEGGTILISHIDLDTIGGVLAIAGEKPNNEKFWEAAEMIDVNGGHHLRDIEDEYVRSQLIAYYAWEDENRWQLQQMASESSEKAMVAFEKVIDILDIVLDKNHPEHKKFIEEALIRDKELFEEAESKLEYEDEYVRGFVSDGVDCCSHYYSPSEKEYIPATVVFYETGPNIVVGFANNGEFDNGHLSAREIVQELWGPEAGGRDGIAGSPRGQAMTLEDYENAKNLVIEKIKELEPIQFGE